VAPSRSRSRRAPSWRWWSFSSARSCGGAWAAAAIRTRSSHAPRIVLDFRLTDRDGKVVGAGRRDLTDPFYLTRAVTLSTDPLRYEKNLLLDWLQKEFPGATK